MVKNSLKSINQLVIIYFNTFEKVFSIIYDEVIFGEGEKREV